MQTSLGCGCGGVERDQGDWWSRRWPSIPKGPVARQSHRRADADAAYARVLARHMSKYIPGNPTIVVQNMPGAGSLRGANFLYNVAPRDGTTFGTFARNMALLGLIKTNQNVQFDPAKFTWLGSSSSYA